MPGVEKTVQDLKAVADDLGYTSKDAVLQILEQGGAGGDFDPARFNEYVALLIVHAQNVEAILGKVEEMDSEIRWPPCPICGAEVITDHEMDGVYGAVRGWKCAAGGRQHFLQVRWFPVLQRMRDRADVLWSGGEAAPVSEGDGAEIH